MNPEIKASVQSLYLKYEAIIQDWLSIKDISHPQYKNFQALYDALKYCPSNLDYSNLNSIKNVLNKYFPLECINLDSDEETPEETHVQKPARSKRTEQAGPILKKLHIKESISQHKLKDLNLPPSSSYAAKPAETTQRQTLTVPYKKPIIPKKPYDPKEEALKLDKIKEKIYLKNYIKINVESENNSTHAPSDNLLEEEAEESLLVEIQQKLDVIPAKRIKQTPKKNVLIAEIMNDRKKSLRKYKS